MLTDTGPLVALLDKDDAQYARCLAALAKLPRGPLRTTWACFTEAMYLLHQAGSYRYQRRLWQWRRDGRLLLVEMSIAETDRMDTLMQQYQNIPMDLADASLVAVAESRNMRRLFTIDSDFYIYHLADGSMLDIVG